MNNSITKEKKSITHIGMVRTEGILTRIHMMQVLEISDEEYSNIVYNSALEFLIDMYSDFAPEWINKLSALKSFWTWWKSEWNLWEQDLMKMMDGKEHQLTVESYKEHMQKTGDSMMTLNAFGNFLKLCKDVKL